MKLKDMPNEEKKFLDIEGVKILHRELSLQDYPNNETLIAVINAIDQTKAEKEHTHGNITNAGAIGTAANKAIITTTNGVLTTGTVPVASGGTGATTAAAALINLGLTATANELNYMDGVTSNVQEQLSSLFSEIGDIGSILDSINGEVI